MRGFGKLGSTVIAGGTAAVMVTALSLTSSQASWTDTEYDQANLGALDCTDNAAFDTTAWGRIVTAELAGVQIDPIASLNGITVDNLAGGGDGDDLLSEAHDVVAPNDLTDNAWSSNVDASALSLINASLGAGLFATPDVGLYTQYGDAEPDGRSTGAAGVITTSEGGVTLGSADPDAPDVGTLSLQSVLSEVIGEQLGAAVANLADLSLDIGAVASSTSLDACPALWGDPTAVERDYLVAGLDLSFQSAAVGALVTGITNLINALDADTLTAGTQIGVNVSASALSTALQALLTPLGGTILLSDLTVTGTVTADLSSVLALLTSEITDSNGFVSINLGTGAITVDIEAILGSLNGLPANTALLTPTVINTILTAINDAVSDFINDVLEDALQAAFNLVTLDVNVDAELSIAGVAGIGLYIDVDGPIAAPTVGVTLDTGGGLLGLVTTALFLLGIDVNVLLASITTTLAGGVVAPLTGAIATQLDDAAIALVNGVLGVGGVLQTLITALTPVLNLIRSIVDITVNVQPDVAPNPDAPIPPDIPVAGRYFESAMRISLLDPASTAPDGLVEIYLANSSAGRNTPR